MTAQRSVASVFDAWAQEGKAEGMERNHSPAALQALEALGLQAGQSFLDVGCGNGYAVRWAAQRCAPGRCLGIDTSAGMVERAQAMSAGCANASFAHRDLLTWDPGEESFHAVFSMEAMYYLPDLAEGLRRVAGLLVPGGRFACVVDYYAENPECLSWPTDLGVSMTLLDSAGWRSAFQAAGLEVVEQRRLEGPSAGPAGSLFTLGQRP